MSRITKVKAYTNGEVAYISWQIDSMINGCMGFEITRIMPDDPSQNKILAAWVPFEGQSNKDWVPQDTSVWPVQKLSWRDLTLIKSRDSLNTRDLGFHVQYRVRPVVEFDEALGLITTNLQKTYTGSPVQLSYLDEGCLSNVITVTTQYGNVRATFTNGILATQSLAHILDQNGVPSKTILMQHITKINDPVRNYLAGAALDSLKLLLIKAKNTPGSTLRLALYEFDDQELMNTLMAVKDQVEIVLSNTSKNTKGLWDTENAPFRTQLHQAGIKIHDRFFNNDHIGHNKFVVYLEHGKPKAALMGSTNWTPNGLCAQSNNATIIYSDEVAGYYNAYFDALLKDNKSFALPNPTTAAAKNVQGKVFRALNAKGNPTATLDDNTEVTVWFSPNTKSGTVNKSVMPPDLSDVYSRMRKAKDAIFFAVFLPGLSNNADQSDIMTNIITEAISIGQKDHSLLVYGAISSPMAMPNYKPAKKSTAGDDDDATAEKTTQPTTYDTTNVHLVRASNITSKDAVGDFEAELLSAGNAIIHDKIVVIDPFSDDPIVVFGSHNDGFKASYSNDENLVIIRNNPALVRAYAVHVLDIFEHYRSRAIQQEIGDAGGDKFEGFLSKNDHWLTKALSATGKGTLAAYMCSN